MKLFTKTTQGLIAESSNTYKKRSFNIPWMTNEIHSLIQKGEKCLCSSRDEPSNRKIEKQFSNFRNTVADMIKEAKVEYYKNANGKWQYINTIWNRDRKKLMNHPVIWR